MRLIDAKKSEIYAKEAFKDWPVIMGDVIRMIRKQPTIDAVPVVRCRDCKKYHERLGWCNEHSHFKDAEGEFCHPWESAEWKMFDPDYFCADGERKDGDT